MAAEKKTLILGSSLEEIKNNDRVRICLVTMDGEFENMRDIVKECTEKRITKIMVHSKQWLNAQI